MELPNSVGLPAINTYIYVEWDEVTSEEPCGWYHCCVQEYQSDGNVIMLIYTLSDGILPGNLLRITYLLVLILLTTLLNGHVLLV